MFSLLYFPPFFPLLVHGSNQPKASLYHLTPLQLSVTQNWRDYSCSQARGRADRGTRPSLLSHAVCSHRLPASVPGLAPWCGYPGHPWGPSVSEVKNLCLSQPVVIEVLFWQVITNRVSQRDNLQQTDSHFILFFSCYTLLMTPPSAVLYLYHCCEKIEFNHFFSSL